MASDFKLTRGAKWRKVRDSLNNLVKGGGTVAGVVSGLTSSSFINLLSAADLADTMGEIGLSGTAVGTSMQIDGVTAIPMGATKALTLTEIGPQTFLPIRKKSTPLTWQTPFTYHVDRYLDKADESVIITSGKTAMLDPSGRPVKVRIPVPAAKVYDLEIVSSSPSSDEADIGTFETITGYTATVLRHPNDTKKFDVDTGGNLWHNIKVYEFRADDPVEGWHIHSIGPKYEVLITDVKGL